MDQDRIKQLERELQEVFDRYPDIIIVNDYDFVSCTQKEYEYATTHPAKDLGTITKVTLSGSTKVEMLYGPDANGEVIAWAMNFPTQVKTLTSIVKKETGE